MPVEALEILAAAGMGSKMGVAGMAATTSFLHIPEPVHEAMHKLVDAEHQAFNWIHDKIYGHQHIEDAATGSVVPQEHNSVAASDHARFITYYSLGCPHCHEFAPVWKDAVAEWKDSGDSAVGQVEWGSKQCYDEDWKPGQDMKECESAGVEGFPTVKFFPAGSSEGVDYEGDREPDALMQFVKEQMHGNAHPDTHGEDSAIAAAAASSSGDHSADAAGNGSYRFVEYVASGCPHCQHLTPSWDEAVQKWQADHPAQDTAAPVQWQKKVCFDDNWKPGPDSAECKAEHVGAFPTLRLYRPDGSEGQHMMDYHGARTPQALVDFLKHETAPATVSNDHEDSAAGALTKNGEEVRAEPQAAEVDSALAKGSDASAQQASGAAASGQALAQNKLGLAVQTAFMPFAPTMLACFNMDLPRHQRSAKAVAPPKETRAFI